MEEKKRKEKERKIDTYTNTDASQHVVHEHIVDMVFTDTGTDKDPIMILVLVLFPLGHASTAALLENLHPPLVFQLIQLHLVVRSVEGRRGQVGRVCVAAVDLSPLGTAR